MAILLLERGRGVTTDRLIDRFWASEPPATAKAALHTHVSGLRREVGDDVVVTERDGYSIQTEGACIDVEHFTVAAVRSRESLAAGAFGDAVASADDALALWRGRPYAELEDDAFARPEVLRLEEMRLQLHERRSEAMIAGGRIEDALAELEGLVVEHPLRERLWAQLIVARHNLGRHADAVRAFREVEERFAEMGLEPSAELRALEPRILRHDETVAAAETEVALPRQLTSFVGRIEEQARVADLLGDHRLVTLTGAGGSGKTRLAIEVAGSLSAHFDAVFFIDLTTVADDGQVARAVADAMGLLIGGPGTGGPGRADELVIRALQRRRCLVVIDNCEHLLEGSATLAHELLAATDATWLLATSREPLRVVGEQLYRLPPLTLPDGQSGGVASEAVSLFLERASTVRPEFTPGDDDLHAITQICRRLDGMPLAIELAAARMGHLTSRGIADRLDHRFQLLTGGPRRMARHQTLQATLDWSHGLLDERERIVFRRLAVFAATFELDMAEAVCTGAGVDIADILDVVGSLVAKSMVVLDAAHGPPRYRLLETVRSYARDRLEAAGEEERISNVHRDACLGWLESRPRGTAYFDRSFRRRLARELPDLRAALEWSWQQGRRDLVGRLASRAHLLWELSAGHDEEGRRWLERALEAGPELDTADRTACLIAMSEALLTLNVPEVETYAAEALAVDAGSVGDLIIQAHGLRAVSASITAMRTGDAEARRHAVAAAEDLLDLAAAVDDPGWQCHALFQYGESVLVLGDLEGAAAAYSSAAQRAGPELHYRYVLLTELMTCLALLGDHDGALAAARGADGEIWSGRDRPSLAAATAFAQARSGDTAGAGVSLTGALATAQRSGLYLESNEAVLYAAAIAHEVGDTPLCSRLLAAGVGTGDARSAVAPFRSPSLYAVYRHYLARAKEELPPGLARQLRDEGLAMTVDEAVAAGHELAQRLQR